MLTVFFFLFISFLVGLLYNVLTFIVYSLVFYKLVPVTCRYCSNLLCFNRSGVFSFYNGPNLTMCISCSLDINCLILYYRSIFGTADKILIRTG